MMSIIKDIVLGAAFIFIGSFTLAGINYALGKDRLLYFFGVVMITALCWMVGWMLRDALKSDDKS